MEEQIFELIDNGVEFPVAFGSLGEGDGTPRAVLYRIGGGRQMHNQGLGLMDSRVQVDCFGQNAKEAIDASREIRTLLEGYREGDILMVALDRVITGTADDNGLLHRVILNFEVKHRE